MESNRHAPDRYSRGLSSQRRDTASRIVNADANTVWNAFSNAESLMAWLPPGTMTGRALEYDFRVGGRYRIELRYDASSGPGPGKSTSMTDVSMGHFWEIDPERRIVQTVEFESDDASFAGEMLMTWSFDPVPDGTRVTITADHVPPGISAEDHDAGLRASLDNLAAYVA